MRQPRPGVPEIAIQPRPNHDRTERAGIQYSPAQIAAHHELLATVPTGMHPDGRTQRMGKRVEGFVAGRGTFHAVCQPWLCSYYVDRACDGMSAESSACHSARAQAPHRQRRRSYRLVPVHGWRCVACSASRRSRLTVAGGMPCAAVLRHDVTRRFDKNGICRFSMIPCARFV